MADDVALGLALAVGSISLGLVAGHHFCALAAGLKKGVAAAAALRDLLLTWSRLWLWLWTGLHPSIACFFNLGPKHYAEQLPFYLQLFLRAPARLHPLVFLLSAAVVGPITTQRFPQSLFSNSSMRILSLARCSDLTLRRNVVALVVVVWRTASREEPCGSLLLSFAPGSLGLDCATLTLCSALIPHRTSRDSAASSVHTMSWGLHQFQFQ